MDPCLPQNDPNSEARARQIATDGRRYEWDHSWPPGVGTPTATNKADHFSIPYILRVQALNMEIVANHRRMDVELERAGDFTANHDEIEDSKSA